MIKVRHFPFEKVNYVNAFLAFEEKSRDAFLIDCGAFDDSIKNFVREQKLNLKFLLITHTHYDHVDGIDDFKKAFNVPIYSFTEKYDHPISEGDKISFGNNEIEVFETPGHIADGISFYINDAVFVGDAIFAGAVGGTTSRKFFEEEITHVKNKILSLPDHTTIYPGHGAASSVGIERIYNPFFN